MKNLLDFIKAVGQDIKELEANAAPERHGPTGWFLDRSVDPWVFRFDNGASLTLGNVDQRAYIYPDSSPITAVGISQYRVVLTLMRQANGSISVADWREVSNAARFWNLAKVTNPVRDASGWDFSKAMYNAADTSGPSRRSQHILIRCYFELGIFTEEDILSFGAVKK